MAFVLFGWGRSLREGFVLTTSSCFWFGFLRPKVQLRLVNVTPSPTPSAADAVTGLSTVNTKPVANAATPAPSCAHTNGARRRSEERLLVPEGCDTLRQYQGDSRTDSGKILWQRRGRLNRQSRNGSLNVWHYFASPLHCNYANMLSVLCAKLHVLHLNRLVTPTGHRSSLGGTSILPVVGKASCFVEWPSLSEFPLRGPPGSFHESIHEELGIWTGRFYHLIERRMGGSRETKIGPLVAGQDIDRHTRSSDCKYGSHAEYFQGR